MNQQLARQFWAPYEHVYHKQTERLNQMILDNAHDLIAIHNLTDLSYEYANPSTMKTLGYSNEELFRINVLECIHPEDLNRVFNTLETRLPEGRGQVEFRYRKKDGTYVWLEANGTILSSEDKKSSIIVFSRDITQRKQAEEALRNSELLYRMVVNDQTELIGRCKPDLTITFANQALSEAFGRTAEVLVGKSFLDLLPEANHAGIRELFAQLTIEHPVKNLTNSLVSPTGEVRWLEWTTRAIINESGQVVEYQGVARDVTEQKNLYARLQQAKDELEDKVEERTAQLKKANQELKTALKRQAEVEKTLRDSENHYRTIFENTGTATVIVDKDLKITACNPRTKELCCCEPEDLLGLDLFENFVAPESLPLAKEYYRQRKDDQDLAPQTRELKGLDRQGNVKNLVMNVKMVPDSENMVVSILDVTQQHQVREKLQKSEERFRTLFAEAPIGVCVHREGKIRLANPAYAQMFGFEGGSQLINTPVIEQIVPEYRGEIAKWMSKRSQGNMDTASYETMGHRCDGTVFPVSMQMNQVVLPDGPAQVAFITDISAQKDAQAALINQVDAQSLLLEISKQFGNIMTFNIDAMVNVALKKIGEFSGSDRCYVFLFSEDCTVMSNTHEWCGRGIDPEMTNLQNLPTSIFPWWMEKLHRREHIYIPCVADLPLEAQSEKEILQAQDIKSLFIAPMLADDQLLGYVGFDSVRIQRDWSPEDIVILESVAQIFAKGFQRKYYREAIEASENYYRTIFENTGTASIIIEEDMTMAAVNNQCKRLLHYDPQDLIGKKFAEIIPEKWIKQINDYHILRRINPDEAPKQYEMQLKDGYEHCRDGLLQVELIPGTMKSVASFVDMTELKRVERALRAISSINAAMVQTRDEQELLDLVCQNFVEIGGYSMAWIGYLLDNPELNVRAVASAGHNHGYTHKLNISLINPKRNKGPEAVAIRSRMSQIRQDIKADPDFRPWAKDALRRGYKSCMAIPLVDGKKAFGVIGIYSDDYGVFNHAEENLLIKMGNNLSFAISALRARQNIHQATEELENSLGKMKRLLLQSVSSLARALDIRDPYTAGHQTRVARLAAAIAEGMGFSKEQIEGITVAGDLHDLGKINVPSEILTKPGKLSSIEFALIRTHPEAGYEIVKDIEFPWPVSEVILQHHERMDGSGYPRGLQGEAILMEARIMAVADVVEAMASHRPYRPALGIEIALEEIEQNMGILYDPTVAEACLRLFRKKGFAL